MATLMAAALVATTVAGCATARRQADSIEWMGPPAAVPAKEGEPFFAPSIALQFLVDPYPADHGPSWLGGDVASSIRIDQDRYLWIFGDTLLGSVEQDCPGAALYCDRRIASDGETALISNSIGIAERAGDGSFRRIRKSWPSRHGQPRPSFSADARGQFLWPLAGVRAGANLFVAANRHTPQSGLEPVGNTLLRIANPHDDPRDWEITLHDLPHFRGRQKAPHISWTMALVHRGQHVYLFGGMRSGLEVRTVLARMRLEDMEQSAWQPSPEYLVQSGDGDTLWTREFDWRRLHPLGGLPGTSEATINYDPEVGWYTYQLEPLGFAIRLYTAPDLEGPWANRGVVYEIPARWSAPPKGPCAQTREGCRTYIAYAVKAHPELAPKGGRVLSYNINIGSGNLHAAKEATQGVPGFYVPQMLVGPAEPAGEGTGAGR